jgi:hypothetical protein
VGADGRGEFCLVVRVEEERQRRRRPFPAHLFFDAPPPPPQKLQQQAHGLTGGDGDDGRVSYLINVYYEFGAAENGFYDDTLSVSFASERPRTGPGDYFDHDATITGGTGRFLGATGRMTISDAVWDEDEDLVVKSAKLRFEVYVPNNFPKA